MERWLTALLWRTERFVAACAGLPQRFKTGLNFFLILSFGCTRQILGRFPYFVTLLTKLIPLLPDFRLGPGFFREAALREKVEDLVHVSHNLLCLYLYGGIGFCGHSIF